MAEPGDVLMRGMEGVIVLLEAAAALVIVAAGLRALASFLAHLLHRDAPPEGELRRFARSLLLALDFTIGSDLLKVALRPGLDAVLVAGLVVLVRSVLTLVLEYELRKAESRQASNDAAPAGREGRAARHA